MSGYPVPIAPLRIATKEMRIPALSSSEMEGGEGRRNSIISTSKLPFLEPHGALFVK